MSDPQFKPTGDFQERLIRCLEEIVRQLSILNETMSKKS